MWIGRGISKGIIIIIVLVIKIVGIMIILGLILIRHAIEGIKDFFQY